MSLYNRPPLRWLGGKFNRLPDIAKHIPASTKRTLEPFAGSAVFSLNLGRGKAIINDANQDLASLYHHIRSHRKSLVAELNALFVPTNNTKSAYIALRDEFNSTSNRLRKAALFIYLNRHGWAGMTSYDRKGKFKTPFGNLKSIGSPEAAMVLFAERCKHHAFTSHDFTKVVDMAGKGDFVYADPPYSDSSQGKSFTSYTKNGFESNLQQMLVERALAARLRGATVIISNHYTPETRALYSEADQIEVFDVVRRMRCKPGEPMIVKECHAIYRPKHRRKSR
jgi:DNA adenine methylase